MDSLQLALVAVFTFVCGVICTLAVQFYLFKKYLDSGPQATPPQRQLQHGKAQLPKELVEQVQEERANSNNSMSRQVMSQGNENLAINLTLQFLFNELRNAERVRLWLYRKLNNEFKELLTQSTTAKLLDSVKLRDLNLGTQFPTIKGLEVADSKIDADTGLLESLDLALDLHYSGNFQLSIDVKMLLGKTAYMALQVKRISGKARLQFTRVPYTHWSLSFYSDPILELEVQSQFQGRQLQPQIISIITSQIRRAVKRKHTLPRYKMRYKPFFRRLNDEAVDLSEVASTQLTPGYLEVVLLDISRLNLASIVFNNGEDVSQVEVYCTMSIDSTPWIYLTQYSGVPYMVLDLIISKTGSQQLGVVFKQEVVPEIGQMCVLVETIVSGSPAAIAEMRKGDILVAVDGKKVSSMNQVAKFVKSAVQRRFIIRVERRYSSERGQKTDNERTPFAERKASKSDSVGRLDSPSAEDAGKIKFEAQIKFSDLRDSENDLADTRSDSSKLFKRRKSSSQTEEVAQTPDTTPSRRISVISTSSASSSTVQFYLPDDSNTTNIADLYHNTKEKPYASLITFEETKSFRIDSESQYLNVGVWGRVKGGETPPRLLGYINAPVKLILAQCCTSTTGHYLKCHALLPPDSASLATSYVRLQGYSGFDPTLCYGDILLSYVWESCRPSDQGVNDFGKKENAETAKTQPIPSEEITDRKIHDFIRTHFHRATHCDFCTKKIWLKDAVQCRDCGMVCHKKCEARCQASGTCGAESLATLALEADEIEPNVGDISSPEISLTGCEDNVQGASMMAVKASIANTLFGLKKAGSTSCLAPPASGIGLASRSLPPSPCASRKSSLAGGLGISPDLLEGAEPSVAAPLMAGDLDDGLMSRARDTGKFLYKYLEPQERVEKINTMMGKLKNALDAETTSRLDLSQNGDADSVKLIAQSDLRVQALSVLLLHYCAGLQHAQEAVDRPQASKES
ncbi:PDZ domain-containing protein 8 isoform X1 [Temnothorax curvispinosus]|uniref:PDZ domain-containing protein 8 isoform X1 n=1 Tax=Temnothorax curvispinosus TaxID=300111 RepID=A0A6J1R9B9_9HYME|nr:PDZ domain-containing protein 8 isoform X1 [Temnothorax curvispinosus]XP_024891271.1 PDZ domain-containing protein 8 isoform X1 [Temnothorax curvispinosus]XP_024891272.1 PDZ domain-containing protein 8 isoform X1 [Temnothorax curvispinosus]XP_024891273.1 PDZ domain-containing protein 8 isoform X1 [Temnothorax curvispinosus]XP_024891274.1 PDZ domain-containing protein 8 isoform X1 [Temnothorax curvispinosus]XP_024891275.1 PDZ domain-containing protein 8 isoform X1 [Temnothorax curvispinosus]